ncbi:SDR family NAD(P)-dependent oxidoreductase [Paenibacillus apiarius]|uniref:Polysaccharide biosynthesis protein n=1 Tax=Paenibacillus apiarius TaxID=46240 RepID=A0ABT4DW29_9BACL|nr:SDR family NAD(P)-dependent oxidoreductase [Paenibacillus apiarius]MCY9514180.1 polysaccharide biosynthesis protein [Paenibacillus apiarius]MCY9520303.1 polysaccharide biosynthesis protein [Paenibacillus apiarius]MCY9550355.1 polysaccharide biosynthesis protein [Paenibacillus apiarius]MCY9557417.1 polysaccharide biosynthesis protein [Paenibacillus apiarius]MCY9682404.1 polysaccharide biosynthesis protein [Paenibacillus apiarius]
MHNFFNGKKILIIGGTGTIGTGLLNHLLSCNPAVIRIFSRDEYKQFKLQQQYSEYSNIRYLIGDIRDYQRVVRAMEDIDYVFHAAAMKHVPACEYNPFEAVQTNIIGTQNVIQAALERNVSKVIFTSTDKAIAPANTYGASKLMAERLISAAQYQAGTKHTTFASVRFGNVMGSRGSVIPLFQQQIKEKGYITVTCQKMSRFMMTMNQATTLMLKAMLQSQGGETFVLKMPVIQLNDLAELVIKHTCDLLNLNGDSIEVKEIGLRPGEKMYEELMTEEEANHAKEMDDMFVIPNSFINKNAYSHLKPAKEASYNSHLIKPMAKSKLEELLLTHNLIGREALNEFSPCNT